MGAPPSPPPERLHIDVRHEPGYDVLTLGGELDLASTPELEEAYDALSEERRATVIDLRHLRFMDSTGIRVMLMFDQAEQRHGRRLALVRGSYAVERVFVLTGVDRLLCFVDEPHEVLSGAGGGGDRD